MAHVLHTNVRMRNDSEARKYITKYVEDVHSLVVHGLQPVSQQVAQSRGRDHPEAARLLVELERTLKEHERRLSLRLEEVGTSPTTTVQDAAAGVAGFIAGIYNHVRTEAVSKSVRDDYTFVSHCAVSWLMLMTTARALADHETEELAEQGYRDCARLVMRIDQVMPELVVEELRQDGFVPNEVSGWAANIVLTAWTREDLSQHAA